jgi:CHAT domain-containing protein/tetratricopeptide (TPR) repeat protein
MSARLKFFSLIFLFLISYHHVSGQAWKDRLQLADSLSRAYNYDSAIVVAGKLLEDVEKEFGPEDTATAKVAYVLGICYARQGNFADAETQLKRSLEIREKILPSENPDIGKSLNALGLVLKYQGKYREAEPLYLRSLEIKEKSLGPDDPSLANGLNNLAELYIVQSKFDEAEAMLKRVLAIRYKTEEVDYALVVKSLNSLGDLYREQERYFRAESTLVEALQISRREFEPDNPDLAVTLNYLGDLNNQFGNYEKAGTYYRQALEIWEKTEHRDLEVGVFNLARNCLMKGDYLNAEKGFKRALEIMENKLGPDHVNVAYLLTTMASMNNKIGKYNEAVEEDKRALLIKEKTYGEDHPDVAFALNNLAYDYIVQDNYIEAEPLLKRSMEIFENNGWQEKPAYANVLQSLAELYTRQKKYEAAEPLMEQAVAVLSTEYGEVHPEVANMMTFQAEVLLLAGAYEKADSLAAKAYGIYLSTVGPEHPRAARNLELSSTLKRYERDYKTALDDAFRAFSVRKKNFDDFSIILAERDALTYCLLMRQSAGNYLSCFLDSRFRDDSDIADAANVILASKGQVSDEIYERKKMLGNTNDSALVHLTERYRMLKLMISRKFVAGPEEGGTEQFVSGLDSLQEEADNLECELADKCSAVRFKRDVEKVDYKKLSSLLPSNSVLVEYLKYDYRGTAPDDDKVVSRYLAFTVDDNGRLTLQDLGEAAPIDGLVQEYRRHFLDIAAARRNPTIIDRTRYRELGTRLYEQLWQPIEDAAASKKLVLIAPDGGLNLISFAGLVDPVGRYLVETKTLHYLSSGRDLIRLNETSPEGEGLLAMGDPDYDAAVSSNETDSVGAADDVELHSPGGVTDLRSAVGDLSDMRVIPLPGTRLEIELIVKSEGVFKREAPGHRIIHLATHGYFITGECRSLEPELTYSSSPAYWGENPLLLSGLFLAGANRHGQNNENNPKAEDGILTADEVVGINLSGTRLVVLSACETGLGEVEEGEGVYGLRKAFQIAGVRTVLSILWSVSDTATAEIMSRLYNYKGENLAETIRQLQIDKIESLRKNNLPDHPFTWGGFIALGDWR